MHSILHRLFKSFGRTIRVSCSEEVIIWFTSVLNRLKVLRLFSQRNIQSFLNFSIMPKSCYLTMFWKSKSDTGQKTPSFQWAFSLQLPSFFIRFEGWAGSALSTTSSSRSSWPQTSAPASHGYVFYFQVLRFIHKARPSLRNETSSLPVWVCFIWFQEAAESVSCEAQWEKARVFLLSQGLHPSQVLSF